MPDAPVDPFLGYQRPPAPMGIADYGVNPTNRSAYGYTASEFEGVVHANGARTENGSLPSSLVGKPADFASIQLNAVLLFADSAGSLYEYWVQSVVYVSTAGNHVTDDRLDLFNFSSSTASISASDDITFTGPACAGAGASLSGGAFICDLPRIQSYTASPILLDLKAEVGASGTSVLFSVDRFVYATLGFPVADASLLTPGFAVNGSVYAPSGNFFDAELILGGPGGLTNTTVTGGSMQFALLRNVTGGSGLAPIPYGYDFGGDTGEGVTGTHVAGTAAGVTLSNGSESLGPLASAASCCAPPLLPLVLVLIGLLLLVVVVVVVVVVARRRRPTAPPYPYPPAAGGLPYGGVGSSVPPPPPPSSAATSGAGGGPTAAPAVFPPPPPPAPRAEAAPIGSLGVSPALPPPPPPPDNAPALTGSGGPAMVPTGPGPPTPPPRMWRCPRCGNLRPYGPAPCPVCGAP